MSTREVAAVITVIVILIVLSSLAAVYRPWEVRVHYTAQYRNAYGTRYTIEATVTQDIDWMRCPQFTNDTLLSCEGKIVH